jgi:hypothetical protein
VCSYSRFSQHLKECERSVIFHYILFHISSWSTQNYGAVIILTSVQRPRGQSSSPSRVNNFHFSILSRLAAESIQPLIQWVPGAFPGDKAARA